MEEMNLQIMEMIDQLQDLDHYRKTHGTDDAAADRYGYPFEPIGSFSGEPLSFTETGMRLHTEAMELFDLVQKINRHSPLFFKMTGQLEKLIGQMGSCCITKAVMEQQGESPELLEDLTIDLLRRMTAFSLRKAWASFMESRAMNSYNGNALDLSIRFAALDKRLLATEEKIKKIESGEIRVDTAVKDTAGENDQRTEEAPEKAEPIRPFSPQARALPVDRAALRGAEEQGDEKTPEKTVPAEPDVSGEGDIFPSESPAAAADDPAGKIPSPSDPQVPGYDPEDEDDWDTEDLLPPEFLSGRNGSLFAPDQDLYRIDRSSLPLLLSAMWEKAPPG